MAEAMNEGEYQKRAETAFRAVEKALRDIDADVVDCDWGGDVMTLTFASGSRAVINTQRPTRQIWLAAEGRGYHFSFEPASATWVEQKPNGLELFSTLRQVVANEARVDIEF